MKSINEFCIGSIATTSFSKLKYEVIRHLTKKEGHSVCRTESGVEIKVSWKSKIFE
jgi:hypothetical protein